jgi:lysophospholipase L1-like esterase
MVTLSAADPRFGYSGRMDFSDPAVPVLIWQGTRVSLGFDGMELVLCFAGASGHNWFDVRVDGTVAAVSVPEGGACRIPVPVATGPDRHRLELFKRTEAVVGSARFAGVALGAGATAWALVDGEAGPRFEFFGDSMMVGACNEDEGPDQWVDYRTHNHGLSYPALTAAAFAADSRCVALSGMGIAAGWVEPRAEQVWNRLQPRPDAPLADLKAWQPDVAFVNFGENDDSFTRANGRPFPAEYTAAYVALGRAIRAAYPAAHLVHLRGGMYGGSQSESLRAAWTKAVQELAAGDAALSQFVFTHWSENHPRVSDHRTLARELIAWLQEQPFLARAGRRAPGGAGRAGAGR